MAISTTTSIKNALLDAYGANFNNGTLKVYGGTVPGDVNAALGAATLLGTLTFGATAFASAAAASMTANAITQDAAADATATATFYRAFKSDGTTPIEQGTVTATGGGGQLELNTVNIVIGGPISVASMVRTQP